MPQRYFYLFLSLVSLPVTVFAQSISSFSPASGNVGTLVTLIGTGLNMVTAVAVNGTACVVLDKTSTSVRLLVMPGTTTGPITVTGGTPAASTSAFTVTRTALNTTQQGPKLVGTGAIGNAYQGTSVALSADGTTLAVGAPLDNNVNSSGATWVFTRSGTTWSQQGPKLVGTGAVGGAQQGYYVALSADGTTLAVGAPFDNNSSGATWVFARSGTTWSQQGPKLVGTGAVGNAQQGTSVALSADGTTLVTGGLLDSSNAGATWVFTRSGASWSQQGPKLVGTGAVGVAEQGYSVALAADGTTLAVGAPFDNSNAGATWVFTRSGTTWSQQGSKLVGTGAVGNAQQGWSVALSADGTTLATGAPFDDINSHVGATWVFARNGTIWSRQGPKLVGAGSVGGVQQGWAVALSADGTTLATGGYGDNTASGIGGTWVFTRSGASWSQQGPKLVGTGAVGNAQQGWSVALSADGTTLATGGTYDNGGIGATWVFSTASSPLAQRSAAGPWGGARFFPNPFTEQLTISGGAGSGTLRLFNSTGRTLLSRAYHDGQLLDLSNLPAGLYWLQLDQAPARPLLKR
jgi:hypothetical protein